MATQTIIITGGAGFIGSHLCEYLINSGKNVICVDNLGSGKRDNIKHLEQKKNFTFIQFDVTEDLEKLEKELKLKKIENLEQIYHLASRASPIDYQTYPVETALANSLGLNNMIKLAMKHNATVLFSSTSEAYGQPKVHPQPEEYWGNVNPVGIRSCFSDDTEILTKIGWQKFSSVSKNDEVVTLNPQNMIEYQNPTEIIKERYIGELIHFNNSKIDLMVTPNHNMHVKPRDSDKFKLLKAFEAINWKRAEMLKAADWTGAEKEWFHLPKVSNSKAGNIERIRMDDWLEFLGYYLSEGCVHIRRSKEIKNNKSYDKVAYNVLIAQDKIKNKENCRIIENCLKKLGFNYYSSDDHQFRIVNKQLGQYLSRFGKSKNKFVPTELKMLSKRQLCILFKALMLGDGNKRGDTFYSSSKRLIDDFQEILLKIGMAGSVGSKDNRKKTPVYRIHLLNNIKKDFLTPLYPKREIKHYDGFVYCVNVPNHIIFVRRNGKVLFCGNCYDESKRFGEALMMAYYRGHNAKIKIVRIFNTYGSKMRKDDGRVIPNFIQQALNNQPITIYGDGTQTRSFCYVSDLIDGLVKMMNSKEIGPKNLGNPHEMTILECASKIIKISGSTSQIIFKTLPEDDPTKRQPDISAARMMLGWEPIVNFEEGIKKTIEWFREN